MTELQNKEFEILKQFLTACEKLGLEYYLVCGSALGAVKYGGFIPWDDDIDVALPRKEYEKFCSDAPDTLPEWCFLQNYRTDSQYPRLGSKLRDSRTTYIETMTEDLKINQGVFIDVFPLDGKWTSEKDEKLYRKNLSEFEARRRVRLKYRHITKDNIKMVRTNLDHMLFRLFGYGADTAEEVRKFDSFVSSFPTEDSDIWCNHANSASRLEFAPKTQYGKGAMFVFEGIEMRVPERYDDYLTQKYGDWRSDIPEEKQVGHHDYIKCDLDHPFTVHADDIRRKCKGRKRMG